MIARSFAFIYARNQPNIGLLGIVMDDDDFHALAADGAEIEVDLDRKQVRVAEKTFSFKLDDMELALVEHGGMGAAYKRFKKDVFEVLSQGGGGHVEESAMVKVGPMVRVPTNLQW